MCQLAQYVQHLEKYPHTAKKYEKKTVEVFDRRDRKWSVFKNFDFQKNLQGGLVHLFMCPNWSR